MTHLNPCVFEISAVGRRKDYLKIQNQPRNIC